MVITTTRVAAGALSALALLATASPATASPSATSPATTHVPAVVGPDTVGQVEAAPVTGLVEGDEIVVRGTGFDQGAGIYVAVCVDNGPGEKPSPCLGGVDTEGLGGAVWISDSPPSYAEGLTTPYGPDGSFEVTLTAVATDPVTGVDCRTDRCAVVTRFDHMRGEDRRADHTVPIVFADASGASGPSATEGAADEGTDGEPAQGATTAPGTDASPGAGSTDADSADLTGPAGPAGTGTDATADDAPATAGGLPAALVWLGLALAAAAAAGAVVLARRRGTATARQTTTP